jgi:hypothetical protein
MRLNMIVAVVEERMDAIVIRTVLAKFVAVCPFIQNAARDIFVISFKFEGN